MAALVDLADMAASIAATATSTAAMMGTAMTDISIITTTALSSRSMASSALGTRTPIGTVSLIVIGMTGMAAVITVHWPNRTARTTHQNRGNRRRTAIRVRRWSSSLFPILTLESHSTATPPSRRGLKGFSTHQTL